MCGRYLVAQVIMLGLSSATGSEGRMVSAVAAQGRIGRCNESSRR